MTAGECLTSIAAQYGLPGWRALYDDPTNEALRVLRPNPHILHPGDEVVVPDPTVHQREATVDRAHRFRLARPKARLRLDVREAVGGEAAQMPYEFAVEDDVPQRGRIGADGVLELEIPA